ncbi:hypothetical protein B0T16DRAFT_145770 [Cercophora newfieldiana]|uniref:Uncharacterized protein n=1 Tax=Cercophora newfieldiana TaxID=92897 RepID=A0AA40CP94_9PEZI|nr:hypothetical protein B0T16DRAFT_145770 [Cercophora newfieldiana]
MMSKVQLHVVLPGSDSEEERMLAVPLTTTASHALGLLPENPQFVLTLDVSPKERTFRLQQQGNNTSYQLTLEDVSTNRVQAFPQLWSSTKRPSPPLRSHTVPGTTAKHCSDVVQAALDEGDVVLSWALTQPPTRPLHGNSSKPPASSRSLRALSTAGKTPSKTGETQGSRSTPSALANNKALGSVEELASLELGRFARDFPQFHVPLKRKHQEPRSTHSSKRQRSPTDSTTFLRDSSGDDDTESDSGGDGTSVTCSEISDDSSSPSRIQRRMSGFPCPYSLYNPKRPFCNHRPMKSPKAVEEHLFFHHRRPPFCPVCGLTFDTHTLCNAHIVSRICEKTESVPVVDGLTERETNELSRCLDLRATRTRQYRAMWEIVHPGIDPENYKDHPRNQAEKALRDHWRRNGRRAVLDFFVVEERQEGAIEKQLEAVQAAVLTCMIEQLRLGEV